MLKTLILRAFRGPALLVQGYQPKGPARPPVQLPRGSVSCVRPPACARRAPDRKISLDS